MNALPIVIIGAGMTGLMAASKLIEEGEAVTLIDKGKSVGGRMATRRLNGGGIVDHGAQFFTVRSSLFQTYTRKWLEEGWVEEWFADPYPRYKSVGGMNKLAKHLSKDLNVLLNRKVTSLSEAESGIDVHTDKGENIRAKGVILTTPFPQVSTIIHNSLLKTDQKALKQIESVTYNPCFVGILQTEPLAWELTPTGLLQENVPEGIERIVDHKTKGISPVQTFSIYATGEWSKERLAHSDDEILQELIKKVKEWINEDHIIEMQVKKWLYSETKNPLAEAFVNLKASFPLFVAGDACIDPSDTATHTRLETAFLSGIAAAEEMAKKMRA